MRRSVTILVAAAMLAGTSAGFAPAQAAMLKPAPTAAATAGGSIEQIDHRRHRDRWRDNDGWNNDHRRNRRHHRERAFYPRQFYFGFPFAMAPPYYPYGGYQRDCFRTWDGQLLCR